MLLSRAKVCATLWLMMGTVLLPFPQAYCQQDALEDAARKATAISKTAKTKLPAKDQSGDRMGKSLNSIMTGCPHSVRRDFLASMVIVGGHLASADLNAAKQCLNRDQYAALLDFFQFGEDDRTVRGRFCSVAYGNCQPRRNSSCSTTWCGKLPAVVKAGAPIPQNSDTGASYLSIEDVVARCPHEIRNNYLDSLVFINGQLEKVSASPACP